MVVVDVLVEELVEVEVDVELDEVFGADVVGGVVVVAGLVGRGALVCTPGCGVVVAVLGGVSSPPTQAMATIPPTISTTAAATASQR
jgi:hypothetical protein